MESSREITKFLGSGSYGKVQEFLEGGYRRVIKLFSWEELDNLDFQFDLFVREVTGLLQSPLFRGILVEKLSVEEKPSIALVMDRYECTLHQLKHDYKAEFSHEFVRQIFLPVMTQLQTLHQDGLLHRDIKPANILLCDKKNSSVLIDWSLMNSVQTKSVCAQTQTFRPPEIFEMRLDSSVPVVNTLASDVFAFGLCILFALLHKDAYPIHEKDKEITSQENLIFYLDNGLIHYCIECNNDDLKKLLLGCLEVNPSKRWTMTEVSQSPFWTTKLHGPLLWHFVPCVGIKQAKNINETDVLQTQPITTKEAIFVPVNVSSKSCILPVCALTMEDRDIVLDHFLRVAQELSWTTDSFVVAWSLFDHAFDEKSETQKLVKEEFMQLDVFMIVYFVHILFEGHVPYKKGSLINRIWQACLVCGLVTKRTEALLHWMPLFDSFCRLLRNIHQKMPFTQQQKQQIQLQNLQFKDLEFRKHFLCRGIWKIL